MVTTAEWVHRYGHHPAILRHRHANPRRARSRLGTRPPPLGTTTTSHHRHQINQPPQNPGLDTPDEAAVKLLWLAICNIEDKRARQRQKEQEKGRTSKSATTGRLIEGAVTTNWKQALQQLPLATPTESTLTCNPRHIHK